MLVKLTWFLKLIDYKGITIWPFIFYRDKEDKNNKVFLNHERIHIKQQIEMLIIPFFICYLYFYIVNRIKGMNFNEAYRNNPFEIEAYVNEDTVKYRSKRKFYAWIKYVK